MSVDVLEHFFTVCRPAGNECVILDHRRLIVA
jgi:hypothetical protein